MTVEYKSSLYRDAPSVVRFLFSPRYDHYFIWKLKALHSDMEPFMFQLNKLIRAKRDISDHPLYPLAMYIREHHPKKMRVEVLGSFVDPKKLLYREQQVLNRYRLRVGCLNTNESPAITNWVRPTVETSNVTRDFTWEMKGWHADHHAIVKLLIGARYFIWKCKSIHAFPVQITQSFDGLLKRAAVSPQDPFFHAVAYAKVNKISSGTIKVLFKTDDARTLVLEERSILKQASKDPLCLNNGELQHIPAWISEQTKFKNAVKKK